MNFVLWIAVFFLEKTEVLRLDVSMDSQVSNHGKASQWTLVYDLHCEIILLVGIGEDL